MLTIFRGHVILRYRHYFSFIISTIQKQAHGQSHMTHNLSVLTSPWTNLGQTHTPTLFRVHWEMKITDRAFFHDSWKEVSRKIEYFLTQTLQKSISNQRCPATQNPSILFIAEIWISSLNWPGKTVHFNTTAKILLYLWKKMFQLQTYWPAPFISDPEGTIPRQFHDVVASRKNCRSDKSVHQDSRKTHFTQ